MLITLLFLLFYIQHEALCNNTTIKPNIGNSDFTDNKDMNLVSMLKQHLRKYNDDYINKTFNKSRSPTYLDKQIGTENSFQTNLKEFTDNFSDKTNKSILNVDKNRRAIDSGNTLYNSIVPVTNLTLMRAAPAVSAPNQNRIHKVPPRNDPNPLNSASNYTKDDLYGDKAERLKQFMIKNKGLIRNFIKNKRAESQTEPMPPVGPSVPDYRVGRTGQRAEESNEKYVIPSPDQLDMAPAKGGRIHSLRIKGRVCQRHVLLPEGPKYDSGGRVYLRAYSGAGGGARDYAHTNPPRLVLPHCCNCCKKSVLGCE